MHKPDSFVMMVALMSEKMVQQERVIVDLNTHISDDHAHMDDMQRTITSLKEEREELWARCDTLSNQVRNLAQQSESFDYLKRNHDELYVQVRKLQVENARLMYGGNSPEETANAYMKAHGVSRWNDENLGKIGTIKVVREITGWGLKETKDFCEAYMARQETPKEETDSGTKRSSQMVALKTA